MSTPQTWPHCPSGGPVLGVEMADRLEIAPGAAAGALNGNVPMRGGRAPSDGYPALRHHHERVGCAAFALWSASCRVTAAAWSRAPSERASAGG
jgi:hypothetical protein